MSDPQKEVPPPPPPPFAPPPPYSVKDERLWAMFCHLGGLGAYVFPFGNVILPLVIWLIKKDEYPLVNDQGKESLNFQLSILIYTAVAVVLVFVGVGIVLVPAVLIFDIVMIIIASIKANEGIAYRYPLTIRFIS
jgi:uncharacterized Tic20 family protein